MTPLEETPFQRFNNTFSSPIYVDLVKLSREDENEIMILIKEKKKGEERHRGGRRERVANLELQKYQYGSYTLILPFKLECRDQKNIAWEK